jgi:hypothetical protein
MNQETYYYKEESDSGVGYDIFFTNVSTNYITHIGKINDKLHADIIVRLLNDYKQKQLEVDENEDEAKEQSNDVIDGVSIDDWINRLSTT